MAQHSDKTPRVVFDCNVYLQAAVRQGGPAYACVEMAESGIFTLLVSAEVLSEVANVLSRPSVRQKFTALTDDNVHAYLRNVYAVAQLVHNIPTEFAFPRDPKDEPYINLAIAARADVIVTRDNDLLSLSTGADDLGRDFRARYPLINVIDPVEFLRRVRLSGPW
jgi:putative PIN family toxin of toxin-antitoxin system